MRSNVLRGDRVVVEFKTTDNGSFSAWGSGANERLRNALSGEFDYVKVTNVAGWLPFYGACQWGCPVTVVLTAKRNYGSIDFIASTVNQTASGIADTDQSSYEWFFESQVENENPITRANVAPNDSNASDEDKEDNTLYYIGGFALLLLILMRK